MHIEYQITESDYIAAVMLSQRSQRGAWLRLYLLPAVCLLPVLPLGIMVFRYSGLSFELIPAILFLCCPAINLLVNRMLVAQSYRDNRAIQSRNFVDIDDTGCRMRDLSTDRFTPWQEVTAYSENRRTFIRFLDDCGEFFITPKRELTPAQIAEFRQLLQMHVPKRTAGPTKRTMVPITVAAAVILPLLWLVGPPMFR